MKIKAPYNELLEKMFAKIEHNVPGLKTYRHNFGILISSPGAQVFYHSDVPGQSLWQIRGQNGSICIRLAIRFCRKNSSKRSS